MGKKVRKKKSDPFLDEAEAYEKILHERAADEFVPEGFIKDESCNFKGAFAVGGNVVAGILLAGFAAVMPFVFDWTGQNLWTNFFMVLAGIGVFLAVTCFSLLFELWILRWSRAGKCKPCVTYAGRFIGLRWTTPIGKAARVCIDVFPLLIVPVIGWFTHAYWDALGPMFYTAFILSVVTIVPNLAVWIFVIKQHKGTKFMHEKGVLTAYRKKEEV